MPQSEPQKPDSDSKSQRKKDVLALQKIGESLVKLTTEQLATFDLPDNLLAAIQHMKSLTSNEAKRRQLQYIGKIMRQIDTDSIKETLKRIESIHKQNTGQMHLIETWRTKLLAHGDSELNLFLVNYPYGDRQELRQLIRNAQQDIKHEKNTGAEKALFRYLRALIENER
jgi:ribosome-associated protein